MGHWIELKPEGAGTIEAWRADPAGKPRGGIVVIQEIFGVNAHIRAVADHFASEGYLAIAPAVFDHVEKGFDVGYDAESQARGMAIGYGKVDFEQTFSDVAAAIEVAKEGGKVGIVGYCFGGSIAWAAACRLPGLSAAVGYYGRRIIAMKDMKPRVPTMLHFGEKDEHIFRSPACAKSPPPTRTCRSTSTPPATASTAIIERVLTPPARRSPGRGRWSFSESILGNVASRRGSRAAPEGANAG